MDISEAIGKDRIVYLKGAAHVLPTWEVFENLFDSAINDVIWGSFATMNIDRSESYSESFDHLVGLAKTLHHGDVASVLSIIHFENSEDNTIPEDAVSLYNKFKKHNLQQKPHDFTPEMMQPTIHSDPVDGIFIQCVGKTEWRAYYEDFEQAWLVKPGDLLYIPKNVVHSVKTLEPRAAISIGFI